MRETVISYAFLAPVLFFFVIFVLVPMIMGFITSFFNYSMTKFEFVGLDNYIRMFKDPVFMKSLINTVFWLLDLYRLLFSFRSLWRRKPTIKMLLPDLSTVSSSSFLL